MHKLLNINELSTLLQVSVPTLYRWVHQKKIPYVKLGGKLRFAPEDITNFISKNSICVQQQIGLQKAHNTLK